MKLKTGITGKLFIWYSIFVLIFFGTVLVLYVNVHQMMRISEDIMNKNYKISSASKRMIESLLTMEENEKKYLILRKSDYLNYFISAQKEFEESFGDILGLESRETKISFKWKEMNKIYQQFVSASGGVIVSNYSKKLWIPEAVIDEWIRKISEARSENELEVEQANRELNRRGQMALRSGLVGLGISILVGLLGGRFLAHSMIRPLRELLAGIRSISKARGSEPIHIRSKDEFGEVARAYNETASRLKEEKRMRSDFISMLSHEIRTPLTSIRESVSLIREGIMGEINARQGKFLEIADLEIGRVCDLLNRLMEALRLESNTLKIQPVPLDPVPFVAGTLEQIRPAAAAKNNGVEAQLPDSLPHIMADAEHLQRVFFNIIGNAIKFSAPGTNIFVRAEHDERGKTLTFFISDNGPGIPDEEQSFIFNKYYRARGIRDHMDGVGLGLSISKHIIEAHGGTIGVRSSVGEGSEFYFKLPAV